MIIWINGGKESVNEKVSIIQLILDKGISPDGVVVEHNLRIVPKEEWADTILRDEDKVEIVSFMGGGSPWKIH